MKVSILMGEGPLIVEGLQPLPAVRDLAKLNVGGVKVCDRALAAVV
jgi:hypothetical protein